jgi:hypothetical protein
MMFFGRRSPWLGERVQAGCLYLSGDGKSDGLGKHIFPDSRNADFGDIDGAARHAFQWYDTVYLSDASNI